eukprot:5819181-Pyramimonas_sp.AAC.1
MSGRMAEHAELDFDVLALVVSYGVMVEHQSSRQQQKGNAAWAMVAAWAPGLRYQLEKKGTDGKGLLSA